MGLIILKKTKRTDSNLLARMAVHYSQPRGFVGRNICYGVWYHSEGDPVYHGHIVGGSACKNLPGRNEVLPFHLNEIVNNIFFNVSGPYPERNFTTKVVELFETTIRTHWYEKYGDVVRGFETLVELPRTGELYRRAGWLEISQTKGYTCKRIGGRGTDSWSGKRVWDTKNLRPKRVFVKSVDQTGSIWE